MLNKIAVALAIIVFAIFCIFVSPGAAEKSIYAGAEQVRWREFAGGSKLLEESGQRYFIGLESLSEGDDGLLWGLDARVYGNRINYDGQTQDRVLLSTKTDYSGWLAEPAVHYRNTILTSRYCLDYILGLGMDSWNRVLKNSVDANGRPVFGYKEAYTVTYSRVGVKIKPSSKRKNGIKGAAGVKLPIDIYEKAFISDAGYDRDPTLKPIGNLSFYGSIGYSMDFRSEKGLDIALYYDSYSFMASPDVTMFNKNRNRWETVKQPDSEQQTIGLKINFYF